MLPLTSRRASCIRFILTYNMNVYKLANTLRYICVFRYNQVEFSYGVMPCVSAIFNNGLMARKVEGGGTEYIRKVNHVLRTIVIALASQYLRRQPSLYFFFIHYSRAGLTYGEAMGRALKAYNEAPKEKKTLNTCTPRFAEPIRNSHALNT